MARKANLFATITVEWQKPWNGHWDECEVEVDYTYDGENIEIIKAVSIGEHDGLSRDDLLDDVEEQLAYFALEAYEEWLADYGEYLSDQAADRAADREAA